MFIVKAKYSYKILTDEGFVFRAGYNGKHVFFIFSRKQIDFDKLESKTIQIVKKQFAPSKVKVNVYGFDTIYFNMEELILKHLFLAAFWLGIFYIFFK